MGRGGSECDYIRHGCLTKRSGVVILQIRSHPAYKRITTTKTGCRHLEAFDVIRLPADRPKVLWDSQPYVVVCPVSSSLLSC